MRAIQLSAALALVLIVLPVGNSPTARAASNASVDVAVVVGSDITEDKLPLVELRKILRGEQQFWRSGKRITLLIRAPQAHERDVVLKKVCQMTEAEFRQHWI